MNSPEPLARVVNQTFSDGSSRAGERIVPEECPIAFTYDRQTHAVMLATPYDLKDFAVGFSLTEQIVSNPSDIEHLDIIASNLGVELRMDLRTDIATQYVERRRSLLGATGCGMCGIESLKAVGRPAPPVQTDVRLSSQMVCAAMSALSPAQRFNQETRAVHAAAFWTPRNGLVTVREDVGRHNALDKLAGALAEQHVPGNTGTVLITSRVSLEMVLKTAQIGAGILIAVSAPTALAIRTAEECGITLIAIARGQEFEIFSHAFRIIDQGVSHAD